MNKNQSSEEDDEDDNVTYDEDDESTYGDEEDEDDESTYGDDEDSDDDDYGCDELTLTIKDNNKDDKDDKELKTRYVRYMDEAVEKIKKASWGRTIYIETDGVMHRECSITKNVRFDSYIFKGYGSKNILKYFIEKTKNEKGYGYNQIVQLLDDKGFRRFIPIRNWTELWKQYEDEPIKYRYLFEVIRSDQPSKPYLDIEWKREEGSKINHKTIDYTEFVNRLKKDVIGIFKSRYDVNLDNNNVLILTSHSIEKSSFHLIINKEYDDGSTLVYKTNRKGYQNSAWDLWVALVELDEAYYEHRLDESVFSLDREFRAIYSNKTTNFRPVFPYGKKSKINSTIEKKPEKCLKYMITYTSSDKYTYIDTPKLSSIKYLTECDDQYYNYLSNYQSIYPDPKINNIINLARFIHPTCIYTGKTSSNGYRFSYVNKTEACYTGRFHENNGFYVYEDARACIYMQCMSSSCANRHVLKKGNNVGGKPILKKLF